MPVLSLLPNPKLLNLLAPAGQVRSLPETSLALQSIAAALDLYL